MHAASPKDEINYAFADRPDAGETMRVAPGIFWLRMPLPFALAYINLWLLEDGDAWTIVDTGVCVDDAKAVWREVISGSAKQHSVKRIIVTHLHPDHAGCAGWLAEQFDAELWMTREEYLLCRILVADTGRPTPDAGNRFYKGAGFPPQAMDNYHKIFGFFGKFVSPLPESYRRIQDGDNISIGDSEWQVIVGRGHSPEHACLFCEERNLLISGDQLLPTISSNVSVYPTEPLANPLKDWLESLENLRKKIPSDVLVLPAHGKPFRGAHGRLNALMREHADCLDDLEAFCAEPKRAVDVFPVLFKSKINDGNLIMATGESIAHLNYLMSAGRMTVETDGDGVSWYRSLNC